MILKFHQMTELIQAYNLDISIDKLNTKVFRKFALNLLLFQEYFLNEYNIYPRMFGYC